MIFDGSRRSTRDLTTKITRFVYLVIFVGMSVAWALLLKPLVGLVRWVTDGQSWGMATGGWLIIYAPVAVIWALVMLDGRDRERWRTALFALLLALIPLDGYLLALEKSDIAEIVSGPGGTDFVIGVRNGALGAIVPLVVVPLLSISTRITRILGEHRLRVFTAIVVAFALATLIAAVIMTFS